MEGNDLGNIPIDSLAVEKFILLLKEVSVCGNPSEFNNIYIDYLSSSTHLVDGALEICRELSNYCTLILATNGLLKIQKERLSNSSFNQYIKYLITFDDTECIKPSKEYFRYIFEKCDLYEEDKKNTLIVGDSLSSDIAEGKFWN